MSFINSELKILNSKGNNGDIWAYFWYPKLVISESETVLRIVDVEKDGQEKEIVFPAAIIDKTTKKNFVWIILESSEIFAVDLINGAKVKMVCNNTASFKVRQFIRFEGEIFLISSSQECLKAPFLMDDFSIDQDVEEVNITLEKVHITNMALKETPLKSEINGLDIYLDSKKLIMQCPLTGIKEIIDTTSDIDNLIAWDQLVVMANKSLMWIVDLITGNVVYQFNVIEKHYYPLVSLKNIFYYLIWNKETIEVCCAWNNNQTEDVLHSNLNISSNSSVRMSSQDTLKLQLQAIIDSSVLNAEPMQVLNQLQQLFDKIEDLNYLINTSLKLCEQNIAFKPLLYPIQNRANETGDENIIFQVCDIIIKIDLLEYIHFRQLDQYKSKNIMDKDFYQLIVSFLTESDIDLACMCWLKYSEINIKVTTTQIIDMLNVVPHNIKISCLIIWLRNFTPSLLDENPFYIDLFVRWTTERVFLLEQSVYWPKIGIKFIEEIQNVLMKSLKTITIRPISMDDLDVLKNHIKDIKELKERYKINMLLGELSSQRPDEISLIMLRRCYTEDLNLFVQDYLPSYAARHNFDLDDTLRTYIENDTATRGGGVDSSRLHILLNSFRSITSKMECLLSVLKVLDVPWDSTVLDLAVAAAASSAKDYTLSTADHALSFEIQKELCYSKIKVILKKYNFPMIGTDYILLLHKLINCQTIDLNDLKIVTSVLNSKSNYGAIMYVNRCLRECETGLALDYFENLPHKEKKLIIKAIVNKFEQILDSCASDKLVERNYLDFLKGSRLLNDIQINTLENVYHLKNSYDTKMKLNDLYIEKYCTEKVEFCMNKDEGTASSGRGGCLTQLTRMHKSNKSSLINALKRISSPTLVKKFVEMLVSSHSDQKTNNSQTLASILSSFRDGCNTIFLMNSFSVLVEVAENCEEKLLHGIIKSLTLLNSLINNIVTMKNLSVTWKYHYIFLSMPSVAATNDLIDFYTACHINDYMKNNFECVCSRGDFIMLSLISNVIYHAKDDFRHLLLETQEKIIRKYLTKMAAFYEIDLLLVTSLLILLNSSNEEPNYFWILDALRGVNENIVPSVASYLALPIVRRTFAIDSIISPNRATYQPHYILKSKFNLNLADIALPDVTEETWDVKIVLFYVLKQYPESSFERIVELCRALNISVNDGLSLQLISLLSSWNLEYRFITDDLGCRQIQYLNDESLLLQKCLVIWENIKNKSLITGMLNDFWKYGEVTLHGRLVSINPYYYEVYLCIYYLLFGSSLDSRPMKEYFILNFLKTYRRKGSPKQYEFELFSVKGMFPEIGLSRLPFHLFMREDMWTNLRSEITLETYEYWLPAVSLLSLDVDSQTARDMICSNALKQTMTTRSKSDGTETEAKETEAWRLITREEPLLRAAHRCAKHIANMEWAGACLFYVLQGCARGADQVAAAQLCYQFAQRWAALQPGNRAVRQMERLHSTLSTRHALHKIEWAREEFLSLSAEPLQLIRALYLHPDFIEKMSRHDVNRAVNEIADKNGINISSIRIQIISEILNKTNEEGKNKTFASLNARELVTAKYILKATCPKMGAIYLSRIAFDDDSDFNRSKKLRALQCLLSIVEPETAMKVTNQERDTLWSLLLDLLYSVNLENIDLPWIVATFSHDKVQALDQLMQSIGGNVDVLKVASELARRYGTTLQINNLIPLMLRSSLYEELIPLLHKASKSINPKLTEAWRTILLSPFQRADYPITDRLKIKCIQAINLLPVCPVVYEKDLIEMWKHCIRLKCYGIGCLILPYMSENTRKSLSELQKIDRRNLIASLKNLQTETYLVSGAMFVLESMVSRSYR